MKKYFVVIQIETDEDINDVVGYMTDHGGDDIPSIKVIQVEEADKDILKLDGVPTLMYP